MMNQARADWAGRPVDYNRRAGVHSPGFAVGREPDFVDARKTNAPEEEMEGASPRPPCRYGEECLLGRSFILQRVELELKAIVW